VPPGGNGTADAGGRDGGAPPSGDDAGAPEPPPALMECPGSPSIDRLQQWLASGEGVTDPPTGTMLVRAGDRYEARIRFLTSDWHVAVVSTGNQFEAEADLSASRGFTLTYSATDELYVQLRPASHWSGGDKYVARIPSTGGQLQTRTFSFAADAWTTLPELGTPSYSFASALREVRGLVFVGKTPNTIVFSGLRMDGYTPPCL